jgi:hypothetical protein
MRLLEKASSKEAGREIGDGRNLSPPAETNSEEWFSTRGRNVVVK